MDSWPRSRAATPQTRLLAGGTDLVRAIRVPGSEPDTIIDLSGTRRPRLRAS